MMATTMPMTRIPLMGWLPYCLSGKRQRRSARSPAPSGMTLVRVPVAAHARAAPLPSFDRTRFALMLAFVPVLLPGSLKGLLRLLSLVPVLIRSLLVAIIVHCVPPAALGRGLAS